MQSRQWSCRKYSHPHLIKPDRVETVLHVTLYLVPNIWPHLLSRMLQSIVIESKFINTHTHRLNKPKPCRLNSLFLNYILHLNVPPNTFSPQTSELINNHLLLLDSLWGGKTHNLPPITIPWYPQTSTDMFIGNKRRPLLHPCSSSPNGGSHLSELVTLTLPSCRCPCLFQFNLVYNMECLAIVGGIL